MTQQMSTMDQNINAEKCPVRATRWRNMIFFMITTFFGVVGAPYYIWRYGVQPSELALMFFFMAMTGLSVTVGYHRLFAHVSYKAHPIVQFIVLFFGAAAYEQSALKWASQHRRHHKYVDTDQDPYNIKKGFFYAHMGWLIFWKQVTDFSNVKDLEKNRMVTNQNRYYFVWAIVAGMVVPLAIGALTGRMLGAFIFAVCLRLTLVYHSTFFINSVCHTFGKSTYDLESSARDHWFVALLTFGEGYHSYHHKFPSDYRNGVRWYHWDPSKWIIFLLSKAGLTTDLTRTSKPRMLAAKLDAETKRVNQSLQNLDTSEFTLQTMARLREIYQSLKQSLEIWETSLQQYQRNRPTPDLQQMVAGARQSFISRYRQWQKLIKLHPLHLQDALLTQPSGSLA